MKTFFQIANLNFFVVGGLLLGACAESSNEEANMPRTVILSEEQKSGKSIWEANCKLCHEPGLAHAPKIGDQTAWSKRLSKGFDTLVSHAIEGYNEMPERGANPSLSDADVRNAVDYMLVMSK
jgi:cytochrome c5